MGFLPVGIIFIILAVIILGTLGILCCICWSFRRLGNDRQRDEELGQSYELKSLNPQNQVDRRSKLFVEDSRGNRITKPVVLAGWLYGQEIGKLRQTLTEFFTDPEFPPDKYSISFNGFLAGSRVEQKVKCWKRAKVLWRNPKMVKCGSSLSDVNQGLLGDCWFLSAMAGLSEKDRLFKFVVPDGQSFDDGSYTGAFWFRFWRFGEWVKVVVDDFIPVGFDDKPIFISSKDVGEVWPCLLEKAYAKLHGGYTHVRGGFSMSAMVDLSGGFPVGYHGVNFKSLSTCNRDFYADLKRLFARPSDSLVCAGTVNGNIRIGLVGSHAYTVTGVFEARGNIPRLVKLRNPWGKSRYHGPWSKKWLRDRNMINEMRLLDDLADDGEFYLTYQDFTKYYKCLSFCYTLGPSFTEKNIFSQWKASKKKVEFNLFLENDSETLIAFTQCDRRQLKDEKNTCGNTFLSMKMTVFYYDHPIYEEPAYALRTRTYHSSLRAGEYRIIGECSSSLDQETRVFLRIASKSNFDLTELL